MNKIPIFTRVCCKCGKKIYHKSRYYRNVSQRKQVPCCSCRTKIQFQNPNRKPRKPSSRDYLTPEYRKSIASFGEKNGMYKKSCYQALVERYGKKEADRREKIRKEKMSISASGENNPMYGKPSPNKSGNGWKGYYKKIFFRSLLELAFLYYLFENNIQYENAEKVKYQINYISFDSNKRTYYADFIVDNKMYEIKPKKLWNNKYIKLKKQAAEKWCKKNKMKYILFEPERLSVKIIKKLLKNKTLVFIDQYKEKINNYLNNNTL